MKEFELILCEILVNFGIDFKKFMNDKDERIKAHKYCYLLNKFYKFPIDGCFSLCINGPYNHHLTDVLFDIARNYNKLNKDKVDLNKVNGLTDVMNRISDSFPSNSKNLVSELEIFTTFDFICTNYPSMTPEEQFNMLKRVKKHLFTKTTTLDNLEQTRHNLRLT